MIPRPEQLLGSHTAVSLFSGCGGLDLGVAAAGFNVLASVEIDRHAVSTLQAWTDQLPYSHRTYHQDITELDPAQLMLDVGLVPGELDLLVGGPPCQSFSGIGFRRGLEDARGLLLFEMARFAAVLRPRAILIEQVKGLINFTTSAGQKVLDLLRDELHELGYETWWQLLPAADYGVPQKRERVLIVAMRTTDRFSFPNPTHAEGSTAAKSYGLLKPHETVGDALTELPAPTLKGAEPIDPNHVDVTPERDRERISRVPEGDWLARQLHLPPELRCNLTRKDTTKYRRLHRSAPSLTLRCGEIHYHPVEDRYLTPREYLRIHGYPDWFTLFGPIRSRTGTVRDLDQHRQVANSVPPPLARVVADRIRAALEERHYADDSRDLRVQDDGCVVRSHREPPSVQMPLLTAGVHSGE